MKRLLLVFLVLTLLLSITIVPSSALNAMNSEEVNISFIGSNGVELDPMDTIQTDENMIQGSYSYLMNRILCF